MNIPRYSFWSLLSSSYRFTALIQSCFVYPQWNGQYNEGNKYSNLNNSSKNYINAIVYLFCIMFYVYISIQSVIMILCDKENVRGYFLSTTPNILSTVFES